jgi:hypothetical protein
VADFNGDGKLDLAVANLSSSNSVNLLLGNGDGSFHAAPNVVPGLSRSVAVGDFNGDGKPDLAVAGLLRSRVSVVLGNGDGSFQAPKNYAVGTNPSSVAVGDFDGDGKPDLVVANTGSDTVSVLLGNGDGTFQAAQQLPVPSDPISLAVGDFNGDGRLDVVTGNGGDSISVLLNALPTVTTLSGPASSPYLQSVTYTATVTSGGAPVTAGTVTFLDGNTPISGPLPVDANGQATFSIAGLNSGNYTISASYSGTPGGADATGFGPSSGAAGLTVTPLPLSAAAVNFSATAGAPFTEDVATFTNPDPFHGADSYTAFIDWGDGIISEGTITGTGTLTVSGFHTYAAADSYAISVQISHNLGDTTTAIVYPTATVTDLGQSVQQGLTNGIGFWNNKNGQRLIDSFNGGPDSTAFSTWLATVFPNSGGAPFGLFGASNAQVAALYQGLFAMPGSNNLQAEELATLLNIYATTQSLGGTAGEAYGFDVTATGLGADSFNVGSDGAAFGVANNTVLNVYELLEALNANSATLEKEANDLFDALNKAGAIS